MGPAHRLRRVLQQPEQRTRPKDPAFQKVQPIGRMPVKFSLAAYDNVVRPAYAAAWQLQASAVLIFPE